MKEGMSQWLGVVLTSIALLSTGIGVYGKYTSDLARIDSKASYLEKKWEDHSKTIKGLGDEVAVLWVDSQKNKENIDAILKTQGRFDATFVKFTDAVNRLSISVAKLEERLKSEQDSHKKEKGQ